MSATSAGSGAPQNSAAAHQQPTSGGRLSLQDITQYFQLPIAEAASNLGVCTSVLKRICRENGIIRWPYRKFLAGKTVDDINKEAAKEKTKELAGLSNTAKQKFDAPNTMRAISSGISTFGNQVQNRASIQQGVSFQGNALHSQGNKNVQHGLSNSIQNQPRHVPTYFDDFKYGFPQNGLSSVSNKWWGSNKESDDQIDLEKSATNTEDKQGDEQTDSDANANANVIPTEPSASLVSLRKRAIECERESLQFGISNCEFYKLGKRKRLLLFQVFGSSLPDEWKDGYS